MCINGHHNRLGDSEASAGMAWMSPKRRGRAQRRVSGKTQLVRGQLNFGLCPAPRRNCHRKNCCSGTPDHPRGQPDNFCGGAHHVGCVKGRRLSSTCEDSGETLARGLVGAGALVAAPRGRSLLGKALKRRVGWVGLFRRVFDWQSV